MGWKKQENEFDMMLCLIDSWMAQLKLDLVVLFVSIYLWFVSVMLAVILWLLNNRDVRLITLFTLPVLSIFFFPAKLNNSNLP